MSSPSSAILSTSGAPSRAPWWLLLAVLALAVERIVVRQWLGLNLHYDEAQYALWAVEPAFGYFSKPPVVAWAIGAARLACGDTDACVRLPSTIALSFATVVVYLTARRLFPEGGPGRSRQAALAAALVFLLAPLVSFLAWFITTDSLLLLAWALSLYALIRALQAQDAGQGGAALGWWLVTGLAAGIGLLTKYTMGIFAVSAAGYVLTSAAHRRVLATPGPWLGGALAAALFAPNILWNARHGFVTFGHTAEISNLDDASLGLGRLAEFLGAQLGVFGPVAMLVFIGTWWWMLRPPRALVYAPRASTERWRVPLLLWFALPFLAIIAAQALAARAHANWAAPTYVGASLLVAAWLAQRPAHSARRWLVAIVAVNVAIMAVLHFYRPLLAAVGRPLPRDPMTQLLGWDAAGAAVAQRLAQARAQDPGIRLLLDERRAMSLLMHYAGRSEPAARAALVWNPGGKVENHWQLTRDARQAPAGPFLLVSERDRTAELQARFASVQPLGQIFAPRDALARGLYAWRLGPMRPEGSQ